jgi:hypothetical protein
LGNRSSEVYTRDVLTDVNSHRDTVVV